MIDLAVGKEDLMRWLWIGAVGVCVLSLALAMSGCGKKTTTEGKEPIKVGAIFAVTGGASTLGGPEKKTVEMLVEKINNSGGILGRKIELIVMDSGTEPKKAESAAQQLIDEKKVLAIIGPSTSGDTVPVKALCEKNKTILISCAAAEAIVNPVGKYVFKTPQNDSDAGRWILQTLQKRKLVKVGVIAGNDGFGTEGRKQLAKLAPDYGITIAISEAYDSKTPDLPNVVAKLKGQDVQAVINWSVVPAQALVAGAMKQGGLNVPLYQSHGFGNPAYVKLGGAATEGTIFPAGRLLVAEGLDDANLQKALLVQYKKDYESRYGEDVSTFGGHAYDAVLLLTQAIEKAGSTDSEKVRDALENLKGVVGTAGVFNMSPTDHCGLNMDAFVLQTVKDGKFALCKQD